MDKIIANTGQSSSTRVNFKPECLGGKTVSTQGKDFA